MKYKKYLCSLLLFTGLISLGLFSNTNVHAEIPLTEGAFNAMEDEKYGSRAVQHQFYEDYHIGSDPYNDERPLSEIYPNGHWNGMSDIKGDNTNYKKLDQKNNYYKNKLKKAKVKLRAEDDTLNYLHQENKKGQRAKAYDNNWVKKHSYINDNMTVSKYKTLSHKSYRRAYTLGDLSNKIALTKSYKQALKAAKSKSKKHYKIDKIVNPNTQSVFAKIVNSNWFIYKIKFDHHYYYYSTIGVRLKYSTTLEPYNTESLKAKHFNFINSDVSPNFKHVVLKPGTKFKQGISWTPNSDINTTYYLRGKTWKIDNIDSPKWGNEVL